MPQEALRRIVVISWLLGFNFFSIPSQGEFLEICVIFVFALPQHGGDDNNDVLAFLLLYSSKFSAVYIVSVGRLVGSMDGWLYDFNGYIGVHMFFPLVIKYREHAVSRAVVVPRISAAFMHAEYHIKSTFICLNIFNKSIFVILFRRTYFLYS